MCTPFHEADCKELFHMAVSRINGNNLNIGKDEKVSGRGVVCDQPQYQEGSVASQPL
jgi:uncharacterized protein affecting Mg2+/Co2+ transport